MTLSRNIRHIDITTAIEHAMPMRCSNKEENDDHVRKGKKIGKERKSLRRPKCRPASIRILVRLESEWLECKRPRSNFVDSVKYYGICVKPNSRINSIFGARHARKKYIYHSYR